MYVQAQFFKVGSIVNISTHRYYFVRKYNCMYGFGFIICTYCTSHIHESQRFTQEKLLCNDNMCLNVTTCGFSFVVVACIFIRSASALFLLARSMMFLRTTTKIIIRTIDNFSTTLGTLIPYNVREKTYKLEYDPSYASTLIH